MPPSRTTETLSGVLPGGDRGQLLLAAGSDPGSDQRPGGAAAPGEDGDRGPEAGIRAAAEREGPPGEGDRDLLPPHRRRRGVGEGVCVGNPFIPFSTPTSSTSVDSDTHGRKLSLRKRCVGAGHAQACSGSSSY